MPSGQHYSGTNRIPNIKQLMESLDKDKKQRDAEIDARLKSGAQTGKLGGESTNHAAQQVRGKNRRVVTDPVTGKGRPDRAQHIQRMSGSSQC